jgi:hypothetical protein
MELVRTMATTTPTTLPVWSMTGPPLLPGLTLASNRNEPPSIFASACEVIWPRVLFSSRPSNDPPG